MLTRRKVLAMAAMAIVSAAPAQAESVMPYTRAAFEAAQKGGKSILVEIHASWCPTCKAQDPVIDGLLGSPKFKDMVAFRIDFDSQKDEVRAMGAQTQSTLIAFKGAQEMARSVGDTDPASIEKLLASAV